MYFYIPWGVDLGCRSASMTSTFNILGSNVHPFQYRCKLLPKAAAIVII